MTDEYNGPERRRQVHLTDDQIEAIAEHAAAKAVEKMTAATYQAIGKGLVSKLFWLVGVLGVGLYFWGLKTGIITPPK